MPKPDLDLDRELIMTGSRVNQLYPDRLLAPLEPFQQTLSRLDYAPDPDELKGLIRAALDDSGSRLTFLGYGLDEFVINEVVKCMAQADHRFTFAEYMDQARAIKDRFQSENSSFQLGIELSQGEHSELAEILIHHYLFTFLYEIRFIHPRFPWDMFYQILRDSILEYCQKHKRNSLTVLKENFGIEKPQNTLKRSGFYELPMEQVADIYREVALYTEYVDQLEKLNRTPLDRKNETALVFTAKEAKEMFRSNNPHYSYDPVTNTRTLEVTGLQMSQSDIQKKAVLAFTKLPNIFESLDDDWESCGEVINPTEFDGRVFSAICTILLRDNYYLTNRRIAKMVFGTENPSKAQLEKVERSHKALRNTAGKRTILFKSPYTPDWIERAENPDLPVELEEIQLDDEFLLMPVAHSYTVKARGQATTMYRYSSLPPLALLWLKKGVINVPMHLLSSIFRSDYVIGQKIEAYVLTTILPMRRDRRASKTNGPIFTYDTILKNSGVSDNYEKALDALQEVLERFTREKLKGFYDYFMDDVTRKVWIFKSKREKSLYLEAHPQFSFLKSGSHYKHRRFAPKK